jgi:hypothetical protein
MEPAKHETRGPTNSYTSELPYDNDLDQDQLNRVMHKPGEPGYCPPGKRAEPPKSQPSGAQGEP